MPMPTQESHDQLATALHQLLRQNSRVRTAASSLKASLLAPSVSSAEVVTQHNLMSGALKALVKLERVQGLTAYAQNQLGDNSLNFATDYPLMKTALQAVLAEILATLPKISGTQNLALHKIVSGVIEVRDLPTNGATNLVTLLTTLENTISLPQ